jgi:hypothetical protein
MTDTDHRQPYEVAVAMWTAARGGDPTTYRQLLREAADAGLLVGVVWAALCMADVATAHLVEVTGVPAETYIEQFALSVAEEPSS